MIGPIPCQHCGVNFMPHDVHPDDLKLCNNCVIKENIRNPKKEKSMQDDNIVILINCPRKDHADIEEACIRTGVTLSEFFMTLYQRSLENDSQSSSEEEFCEQAPCASTSKKSGKHKR